MSDARGLWEAPAKVNLALSVVGPRPDGFHEIDTVYQAIDLFDRLAVERIDRGVTIRCEAPGIPIGPENLVARAFALLAGRFGLEGGIQVDLTKRIPAGAGLGGGSSDAAATLVAVRDLFGLPLDDAALEALGADLGSDVPFFVAGGTQRGTGRGERLERWAPLSVGAFLVAMAGGGLDTKSVYARGGFGLTPEPDPVTLLGHETTREDPEGVARALFNALEAPAFSLRTGLARLKGQLLGTSPLGVLLAGSGSALFAYYADEAAAREAAARLGAETRVFPALPLAHGVRRID